MKEFIQKSADEVSIVIYDAPLPPKYFRLTKRFIKTLFVIVPLFMITLLSLLFLWGLGTRLKDTPAPVLPNVMSESDSKIMTLENELKDLKESYQALSDKLAAGPVASGVDDPNLMLIKKPYGMQNLLSQNKVTLDQIEFIPTPDKVTLKFQIISATPEHRVTGNVIVFMISDSGLLAWPKVINSSLAQGVKFSMGEPFSVSRLRPTDAVFKNQSIDETVRFIIYIFNREGDLLLMKETDSFQTGAKS
ncbi:MAG: hypothetical protein ACLGHN_09705 [Bacteriovoracia bacterium]